MRKRIEAHRDFMASWVKLKLEQKPILAADRESLSCYPVDDLGLYGRTYLIGATIGIRTLRLSGYTSDCSTPSWPPTII